jgi:hypothetical protein
MQNIYFIFLLIHAYHIYLYIYVYSLMHFLNIHAHTYSITHTHVSQNINFLNWIDKHHMNCIVFCCGVDDPTKHNVDSNVYKPGKHLYGYIHWTFTASFTSVFLSFLLIFSAFNITFGGLLMLAGNAEPNCIMMAGEPFGSTPQTKFSDAFALSWTTFTTVVCVKILLFSPFC